MGKTPEEARTALNNLGLNVRLSGEGLWSPTRCPRRAARCPRGAPRCSTWGRRSPRRRWRCPICPA
ncbi:MAG: hypothetical protein ACLTC3_13020 [Evtepia gabavorous]